LQTAPGPLPLHRCRAPQGVLSGSVGRSQQHAGGVQPVGAPPDNVGAAPVDVVLPFGKLSCDSEQEYFVDGVTETLTTDLSRISGSLVIARNTAFTYKGKSIDVKQIGRELNIRYVLEGSV
jgi:TolB-like protein